MDMDRDIHSHTHTHTYGVIIRNRYPPPLMSSVFNHLQQAKVFTKVDLRNAE